MSRSFPLRSPAALCAAGLVASEALPALEQVAASTAIAVPETLARLIDPADPADPVGRQVLPDPAELIFSSNERSDPIGDAAYSPVKGLVHRYPDRVLLKPIMTCAVYCRFCFRREAVGAAKESLSDPEIATALAYVAERPAIREIIVTGGDPLLLSPRRWEALRQRVEAIAHVEVLRIHTRLPVADPEAVSPALVVALRPSLASELAVWVSVHVNHERELSPPCRAALRRLADGGLALVAQTVLLKGVNDDADVLERLFRALVRNRVKPYYLHHPDLARGTGHFRLTISEGQALMKTLRGRVSGLALPTYVLDIPGGAGKVPLMPQWWDPSAGEVEDWQGIRHPYDSV